MFQEIVKDEIRILNDKLSPFGVSVLEFLSKGTTSFIFLGEYEGKKVIVKFQRPDSPRKTLWREAEILKLLKDRGITGDIVLYTVIDNREVLVREYLEGTLLKDLKEIRKWHIIRIAGKTYALDKLGIDHGQIQGGKHILIGRDVWIIDFEKASTQRRVKNLTSAIAMLFLAENIISRRVVTTFNISEDFKGLLKSALREYKKTGNPSKVFDILMLL
ncbi:serine/threonine protein kinase [Pyrococcus sp. ST04]|uniref:serine/threonine protein kinase n=1 Tax=Pyrococcus sp. ST04 TaxID=1183377 RepID=UPI0002605B39|nr:serine/threonine protein kinase [Pyrococcus sp. ST04]AFK22854.1 putative serine/threonine protein kinase [Pyrococcus sp. ST04]